MPFVTLFDSKNIWKRIKSWVLEAWTKPCSDTTSVTPPNHPRHMVDQPANNQTRTWPIDRTIRRVGDERPTGQPTIKQEHDWPSNPTPWSRSATWRARDDPVRVTKFTPWPRTVHPLTVPLRQGTRLCNPYLKLAFSVDRGLRLFNPYYDLTLC